MPLDRMRLPGSHRVSDCKATSQLMMPPVKWCADWPVCWGSPCPCWWEWTQPGSQRISSPAETGEHTWTIWRWREWTYFRYKFHQSRKIYWWLVPAPESRQGHRKVHVPALGGKCKHEILLCPAQEAHDGDDAVVDLESVAEEGDNKEALDADVYTLLRKIW